MAAYILPEQPSEEVLRIHPMDIADGHLGIYIPRIREVCEPLGIAPEEIILKMLNLGVSALHLYGEALIGSCDGSVANGVELNFGRGG